MPVLYQNNWMIELVFGVEALNTNYSVIMKLGYFQK